MTKDNILYFTGDWDEDCEIMESILDMVEFKSGTARRKMYKQKDGTGGSMLYGLTWKGYLSKTKSRTKSMFEGLYKTKPMDDHPELGDIFKQFANQHFPDFSYTQVQMNKNFHSPKHLDSTNTGESILCAFGHKYKGGKTCVDFNGTVKKYDARLNPVKFDGAKHEHWVESWEGGPRYTLVFFDNLKKRKLTMRNLSLSDLVSVKNPLQ